MIGWTRPRSAQHRADPARRPDARGAAFDPVLDRVDRLGERGGLADEARHLAAGGLARGAGEAAAHEVGVDEAEVGAADARARGERLQAQRVAQRLDAGLGGRVGAEQRRVRDRRQRGDVQQVAAARADVLDHGAVGAPHAEQVDREDALDLLDRRRRQRAVELDAGVGDRDVERAEALDRRAHRALQGVVVGDVDLEAHGALLAELRRRAPPGARARGRRARRWRPSRGDAGRSRRRSRARRR